jgi:hypothetical protein
MVLTPELFEKIKNTPRPNDADAKRARNRNDEFQKRIDEDFRDDEWHQSVKKILEEKQAKEQRGATDERHRKSQTSY